MSAPIPGTHAFVDESARRCDYLLAAVTVAPCDLDRLRKDLRSLRMPGQRELHMKRESDRRQRLIADVVAGAGAPTHLYVAEALPRDHAAARAACLVGLVRDLVECQAHRLVLDSRTRVQNKQDESVIRHTLGAHPRRAGLRYGHVDSEFEPLLWMADIIAWAHGRGGQWRRRVAPAVSGVTDCRPGRLSR